MVELKLEISQRKHVNCCLRFSHGSIKSANSLCSNKGPSVNPKM